MSGTATAGLTTAQADVVLSAIAHSLEIVLTSPTRLAPGTPLTAALVPASPLIDASELANGILNLAWTAKDVLFNDESAIGVPAAATPVTGGEPFPPPIGAVGGSTLPTHSNVLGVLNQIFGVVALPKLKVRLSVSWRVVRTNANGNHEAQTEGVDFVAPQGIASPNVTLILPPTFREMNLDTIRSPATDLVCLYATVTLALGNRLFGPFDIGPARVILLPLLIPTLVALFRDENFGVSYEGAALIAVPSHSPISSAKTLFRTLHRIEVAVDALRGTGGFAAWLLGLDELLGAIPDTPRLRFAVASDHGRDGIPDLTKIEIRPGPLWGVLPGEDFNDRTQSFLVFGLPGTMVKFYNDINYSEHLPHSQEGMYTVSVGPELFVGCRSLNDPPDSSLNAPVTFPAGRISSFEPDTTDDDKDWKFSLSSLEFDLSNIVPSLTNSGRDPGFACPPVNPLPTNGHDRKDPPVPPVAPLQPSIPLSAAHDKKKRGTKSRKRGR